MADSENPNLNHLQALYYICNGNEDDMELAEKLLLEAHTTGDSSAVINPAEYYISSDNPKQAKRFLDIASIMEYKQVSNQYFVCTRVYGRFLFTLPDSQSDRNNATKLFGWLKDIDISGFTLYYFAFVVYHEGDRRQTILLMDEAFQLALVEAGMYLGDRY